MPLGVRRAAGGRAGRDEAQAPSPGAGRSEVTAFPLHPWEETRGRRAGRGPHPPHPARGAAGSWAEGRAGGRSGSGQPGTGSREPTAILEQEGGPMSTAEPCASGRGRSFRTRAPRTREASRPAARCQMSQKNTDLRGERRGRPTQSRVSFRGSRRESDGGLFPPLQLSYELEIISK